MGNLLIIDSGFHWAAVIMYAFATLVNVYGLIFLREKAEIISYYIVITGLISHGTGLIYRWVVSGHGPYMARYEVLSSDAWIALFLFLVFSRVFPKIRSASIVVFPVTLLVTGLAIFFNADVTKLPPALKSIWLVMHVGFIKISLATMLIAVAISIFYILKKNTNFTWLERLPDIETLDIYAYRFAGFGFTFWTITVLAGSIWAFQSWGRFWAWDPIETWSLIAWISFGVYLHLRRFFGLRGENAAYLLMLCFFITILSVFFVPVLDSSIHSSYFQ
jgi:cytochrome c-type biogenesis protein CcsB